MATKNQTRFVPVAEPVATLRAAYHLGRWASRGIVEPTTLARVLGTLSPTLRDAWALGARERGRKFRVGEASILTGICDRLREENERLHRREINIEFMKSPMVCEQKKST